MYTNLRLLNLARETMSACNKAHKHEIFIDPVLDAEDEVIDFDILPSNLEHAVQICGLLNLSLQIMTVNNELKYSIY